jgi:spore germination protein
MGERGRKKATVRKLSAVFSAAALPATAAKLDVLRRLIAGGREAAHGMGRLAQQLKQVAAPAGEPFVFTAKLAENERLLRHEFADCDDIRFRRFAAGNRQALMVFLYGLTDATLLEKDVLETLMAPAEEEKPAISLESLVDTLVTSASLEVTGSAEKAITAVMRGHTLVLVDGLSQGLLVGAIKHVKRSIEESKTEAVARGPHDAFNETLEDNIVLLRRRAADPDVKVKIIAMGTRSRTEVALVYAASLVKPGLVSEVERRLKRVKVDSLLLAAQVEEFIIDHPWSPFPQTYSTERPDSFLASVYEGRVGIIVDNTPNALIVPCTLSTLLQSTEDFTVQPVVASLIRFTRYLSFSFGIFLPAMYVAFVSYNPGMLPTSLAISVAELRARAPYPAVMEVIIMEVILEIFQEAVVRLPQKVAPGASIIGGFVIGTTIVQAGLVNALLVVATAGTAIASYTMPTYNLGLALRWLRLPTIAAAAVLGFYGVVLAYMAMIVHLCSLRSFGEAYLGGLFDVTLIEDMKDKLVRLPVTWQKKRPKQFGPQERTRTGE